MAHLAPVGAVYQAGTLSGNPVAASAGLTTLRLATEDVYDHIGDAARVVREGVSEALAKESVPHVVQSDGTMFSVFFTESDEVGAVYDFAGASAQRLDRHAAFFHAMLDHGVHLPPSAFEVWFLSAAHDHQALDRILDALPAAARAAAAVPSP
jgi:glutamate-1-semialdehyde 2,1-aminomutase